MKGNVVGLEVLEREAGVAIDELVVELPDEPGAVDAVCRGVRNVPGVGRRGGDRAARGGAGPGGHRPRRRRRHPAGRHAHGGHERADRPSHGALRPVLAGPGRRRARGLRRRCTGTCPRCSGWPRSPRARAAGRTRRTTRRARASSSSRCPRPGSRCAAGAPSPSGAASATRSPCWSWWRRASSTRWAGVTSRRPSTAT